MPRCIESGAGAINARAMSARAISAGTINCVFAIACAVGFSAWAGGAPAQMPSDPLTSGREKYVQCTSCHGSDGRSTVVPEYPKIGGQSAPYVVNALKAYRDGRRQGSYAAIMSEVAKPLSDADIANLATYIESLEAAR
jgi:cytochrome c553